MSTEKARKLYPVVLNTYGDTQIVGDISELPLDEASAFLCEVVHAAERGVWLRVPFTQRGAQLIAAAWELGFTRAHSVRGNVVTLQCWRKQGHNPTPTDAFTDIGVHAIVVDSRGRILGMRERYDRSRLWSFPGGHVDPGEVFTAGAVREVREETGVLCAPLGVLGQHHLPRVPPLGTPVPSEASPDRIASAEQSARFGIAHLGVAVLCYALPQSDAGAAAEGPPICVDASEVTEARWLEPDEFCDGAGDLLALLVRVAEVRANRCESSGGAADLDCECVPLVTRPSTNPRVQSTGQLKAAADAAAGAAAAPALPSLMHEASVRLAHRTVSGASYEVVITHAFPGGTLGAAAARLGRKSILAVEDGPAHAGGAPRAAGAAFEWDAHGAAAEAPSSGRRLIPVLGLPLRCPMTWVWVAGVALLIASAATGAARLISQRRS